jgi:hypothetical protein
MMKSGEKDACQDSNNLTELFRDREIQEASGDARSEVKLDRIALRIVKLGGGNGHGNGREWMVTGESINRRGSPRTEMKEASCAVQEMEEEIPDGEGRG